MTMRQRAPGLSLRPDEPDESARSRGGAAVPVAVALLILASLAFFGWEASRRAAAFEQRLSALEARSNEAAALARQALEKANQAEFAAGAAAEGRRQAEERTAGAVEEAEAARQETTGALEKAARAEAEAARIRKQAEAEVNRLEEALGQIAETRRTALGLVMNLGGEHLKFEFDKADLRAQDRELLSRIAGILLTSKDYSISVNGHTDDVGTDAYNQRLSLRRAQAVHDYLVQAGLAPGILSVEGYGKSRPLVKGTSDAARAKNRRVEIGIVNTRIRYGRPAGGG